MTVDSVLVICYSCTGIARRAAQRLASLQGWQLGEIRDVRPKSPTACILDSLLRRRPAFEYEGPPPGNFRVVVIVAPIWAGHLAGPLRSYLFKHADELDNVALAMIRHSGRATKAFWEVARLLGHAPIACAGFLPREVDDSSGTERLRAFGEGLRPATDVVRAALNSAWSAPYQIGA